MKTTAEQRFMMPTHVVERVESLRKKDVKGSSFLHTVNRFFGLETKQDEIWFYGFYTVVVSMLLFMVFVSNMMDFLFS
ncbi:MULTISPECIES: DUF3961 domain-containing protein [unclassified Bacillus (in: firmicutes)]|uniref:DUF3961 domain-containing protein n=1 Tax=unclassified Bacillus (in: firmicutes) TaxID=185979 RepID=UPI00232D20C1|nr:DUF3961 domain-containing protein [Bacillus sp. BP-3]MDC2865959.1 DUF3961 domain-containing protein [Bacillus sp. BP-3]